MKRISKMDEGELKFFYQRWLCRSLPSGTFDGTLFSARLPLPLNPVELDRHCAPYLCGYDPAARPIESLAALLAGNEKILGMGMHPADSQVRDDLINQLYIFNFREDARGQTHPLPIDACLDAGWWCASFSIGALMHQKEDPLDHTLHVQALLGLLGSPDHIMTQERELPIFRDALERGQGSLRYLLVYEKGEYALVVRMTDTVSREYGLAVLSADSCLYYPKPCWDYEKRRYRTI